MSISCLSWYVTSSNSICYRSCEPNWFLIREERRKSDLEAFLIPDRKWNRFLVRSLQNKESCTRMLVTVLSQRHQTYQILTGLNALWKCWIMSVWANWVRSVPIVLYSMAEMGRLEQLEPGGHCFTQKPFFSFLLKLTGQGVSMHVKSPKRLKHIRPRRFGRHKKGQ